MEALISIICAIVGLVFGLMFLWDLASIACSGGAGRRQWVKAGVKLLLAFLLLHFHFELDIID
ncbi:MAG: hypothetical protein ACOY30_05550 [Bacillota bacterium]